MNLMRILEKISVPRPGHSPALEQTASYLKEVLTGWGVPFTVQPFPLRYHFHFLLGLAILILSVLFFVFIIRKKPLSALISVIAVILVLVLEIELSIHFVSAIMQKTTENIIVSFQSPDAVRELIFAAHYDSKTDVWDHIQRAKILMLFPYFLMLCLVLCLWTFLANRWALMSKKLVRFAAWLLSAVFVVYAGFAFSWLGGYTLMDDSLQSYGTIDDGASIVALMGLARHIHEGAVTVGNSNVTILMTSGEETGLQGARWYVKQRFDNGKARPELPASLINLELLGQSGNLYVDQRVSNGFLSVHQTDPDLANRINSVWVSLTGRSAESVRGGANDAFAFAAAGIPVLTIGHNGSPGPGFGGFHSTADNMERVNPKNLALGLTVLEKYIESYNP